MIPHFVTALTGPVSDLEQRLQDAMPTIERWFRLEWMEHTPPFYCSVTVRNAGFKIAPIDTDLYPDSWHLLTPAMQPLAVQAAMAAIEKICPEAHNLLIIPKNGHHSPAYLSSLARLQSVFAMGGLRVRLGSIDPAVKHNTPLDLPDGQRITLEPVVRSKRRLGLSNFDPCTILLNNDLHAGVPGILEDLHEQYLLPPLHASWPVRRKNRHCKYYEELAKRLAKLLGIDPWLIFPMFERRSHRSLAEHQGLDGLAAQIESMLSRMRRKYKEYGMTDTPFVMVKSGHASLGTGCTTVRDAGDLGSLIARMETLNAQRHTPLGPDDFLVQEGLSSCERIDQAVAEPVVYMLDRYVVGGFYRTHLDRGADESLRGDGAVHAPLVFDHSTCLPQHGAKPAVPAAPNRFYSYGVVARLAMLAASYELEATDPDADAYLGSQVAET